MTNSNCVVTLVAHDQQSARRQWNLAPGASSRIVFSDTVSVFQLARERAWTDKGRAVERIVIDGSAGTLYYLELVAALGSDFAGDVLFVHEGQSSFLSAMGRGGDRVIYSLREEDVDFYLQTKMLIASCALEETQLAAGC